MESFKTLFSYNIFLNILIGISYFVSVCGLGNLILKALSLPKFHGVFYLPTKILTGFLCLSLVVQILSFMMQINFYSILAISIILGITFIYECYYLHTHVAIIYGKITTLYHKTTKRRLTPNMLIVFLFILSLFAIFVYASLPSTKIDEVFYHQFVVQRIINDTGLVFYRQPWEAAIPTQFLYNFSHLPLVFFGFADAPNILSFCIFAILLYTVYKVLKSYSVSYFWIFFSLTLACLGMYRLTFTTAASHNFGDFASFILLFTGILYRDLQHRKHNFKDLLVLQGLCMAACFGAKMSLLPFSFMVALLICYELWVAKQLSIYSIFLLSFPTILFFLPIVIWTYSQTNSPFGLALSQYFDVKIIDKQLFRLTLEASQNQNQDFIKNLYMAFLHFPFLLLFSTIMTFYFPINKEQKVKLGIILVVYMLILLKFSVFYNPRFWANLPLTLFILGIIFWKNKLTIFEQAANKSKLFIVSVFLLPYFFMTYYYLYNLLPLPYHETNKEIFYKRFIVLYQDYKFLDSILPQNACLYSPKNRLDLMHAPRRIFVDSTDICNCKTIYLMQKDTLAYDTQFTIQNRHYMIDSLVYQNKNAIIQTKRTPNLPQTFNLFSVYKLK